MSSKESGFLLEVDISPSPNSDDSLELSNQELRQQGENFYLLAIFLKIEGCIDA